MTETESPTEGIKTEQERVTELLTNMYVDAVFRVEDGVVWVSGMNSSCQDVANDMARRLTSKGIPCGLVYDDDATHNGGVQFNFGDNA
jgi:hypothetical protein